MATEVERFNPEVDHHQLSLDAFDAFTTLASAGLITPTSLDLTDPDLPFESYEMLGAYLGRMNRSCSWWIGDWLVFGEGVYGEKFAQAVHATGLAEQTLLNRSSVCRNVARSMRRVSLPFSVHAEVASLPAKDQKKWLDKAEKFNWTRAELRAAMKATRVDTPPPAADDDIEKVTLVEVARAILRDLKESDDPAFVLVPNEDIARLRAAVGEDDSSE